VDAAYGLRLARAHLDFPANANQRAPEKASIFEIMMRLSDL
jgi:hypothetical protein